MQNILCKSTKTINNILYSIRIDFFRRDGLNPYYICSLVKIAMSIRYKINKRLTFKLIN